ncbi:MAG: hypothetical protein IT161_10825 [Bryobacterales bacterium]|nr:hypothetical protein [Bryobacterales bacterium]
MVGRVSVRRWAGILLLLELIPHAPLYARTHRTSTRRTPSLALRRRLFTSTLITPPGTGEFDFSAAGSASSPDFYFPTSLKYTPAGRDIFWGRTEFSVNFDTASSTEGDQDRNWHFSDHVTVQGATVAHNGRNFDFAIVPQVTFLTRGASGIRYGGTLIGRWDIGHNSLSTSGSWSGATTPSDQVNPAGLFDWIGGYARAIGDHWTVYGSFQWERATGVGPRLSVFEGIEFQPNGRWAIDFSGQHFAVAGGQTDNQIVAGVTITLGKLKKDETPDSAPPGSSGGGARGR